MKLHSHPLLLALTLALPGATVTQAQTTAFTYQGRLTSAGQPANGSFDFLLQVFDAGTGGSSVGGTLGTNAVPVSNGLFVVTLDFGGSPFTGANRWLQIQVSTNGAGSFVTLSPRQWLTPAPRAIFANSAGTVTNGAITSAQLAASAVSAGNLQDNSVTAGKIASGQAVKSLNGLTDAISLTQGANVTINTVGNSLQISAATASLALPYSGVAGTGGAVFSMSNSTSGGYSRLGTALAGAYGNSSGTDHSAVRAEGLGAAWGLYGTSIARDAVYGSSAAVGGYAGVRGHGTSGSSIGVLGQHVPTGNNGLLGHAGYGVDGVAEATASVGVRGIHVPSGNFGQLGVTNAGVVAVGGSGMAFLGISGGVFTSPQLRLMQTNHSEPCRIQLGCINTANDWFIQTDNPTITGTSRMRIRRVGGAEEMSIDSSSNVRALSFIPTSDRNAKENFSEVRPRDVLEKVAVLPISRWNFKQDSSAEHIGPMAQDFHAAFGLGSDDKHIATVDADGVAFAAIQGLNEIVKEKQSEIDSLKARLEKLEKLMEAAGGAR